MITAQEYPDEGQVAVDRGVTIGYFSQDVGEMWGRSAVSEVMDGAGPVSTVATELKELEAAMGNSDRAEAPAPGRTVPRTAFVVASVASRNALNIGVLECLQHEWPYLLA
jgi:ATPase subunit of ABC transporter with duplicated ATPase domains